MIITCKKCGDQFGGPKTKALHDGPEGCLKPQSVGLKRYGSKVWRKSNDRSNDRKLPHRDRIDKLNRFEA